MGIQGLFDELEDELRAWLSGFGRAAELFEGLPQLFSKLTTQHIAGTVEDRASIIGPVHVGSRSTLRAGSVVTGPAIIAEDVTIASSVEIDGRTYIGSGCSIAHGVSIRNSLVLNRTVIRAGAHISNSLVGTSCIIGPHALLGIEPVGASKNRTVNSPFVTVRMHSRIGAGAILEYGTDLAEAAQVNNGVIVSSVGSAGPISGLRQ